MPCPAIKYEKHGCVGQVTIGIFVVHGIITPAPRERLMAKATNPTENQTFLTETVFGMETVKSMAIEPGLQRAWET